ncbi:kinase-like protein [Calocera cornea HHB12733]|uniref:Kinase-like protein n=1 Tax=Calocera cornea HHB12733 TaxID=1353952 RepID=A0A165G2I4_9BASI|nr:kinase-like protein [Calocera cornea HHB12733]
MDGLKLGRPDSQEILNDPSMVSEMEHTNRIACKSLKLTGDLKSGLPEQVLNGSAANVLAQIRASTAELELAVKDLTEHMARREETLELLSTNPFPPTQQNVLVDQNGVPKIADFGLSRYIDLNVVQTHDTPNSAVIGTHIWMAPERLDPHLFGMRTMQTWVPASDSYSYGMLTFEVISGRAPFPVPTGGNYIPFARSVIAGVRPKLPTHNPDDHDTAQVLEVMQMCWQSDRAKRPSMDRVLQLLPPRPSSMLALSAIPALPWSYLPQPLPLLTLLRPLSSPLRNLPHPPTGPDAWLWGNVRDIFQAQAGEIHIR